MVEIKIIYQDDFILVLNKPPNLVIDPSDTYKQETLADILQRDFKIQLFRGGIVHRLDKDTSGIILVAKTQSALDNLQSQFKERKIKKEYLALVHGSVDRSGAIDVAIARNPRNREKFTVVSPGRSQSTPPRWPNGLLGGGREAVTEYQPMEKFKVQNSKFKVWFPDFNNIQLRKLERLNYGEFTLLRCKPKTGRTHQIRVHLKYINHPIVADEKYAGRKTFRLDKRWCPRLFLHAAKIGFNHPVSGEWMELESGLPDDLKTVLNRLSSAAIYE